LRTDNRIRPAPWPHLTGRRPRLGEAGRAYMAVSVA